MTPTQITVHSSPQSQTVKDLDTRHRAAGYARCGFHYVIGRDGVRYPGRPEGESSVFDKGQEKISLSVCLIGDGDWTREQLETLGVLEEDRGLPVVWRCKHAER